MKRTMLAVYLTATGLTAGAAQAQILHDESGSIQGSLCVGFDCADSESFGSDTLRLKESNIVLHFNDTSTGDFPSNDWRLIANQGLRHGKEFFAIADGDTGRFGLVIEAGTKANALYVSANGEVGFGTSAPNADLHVVDGNTPTLRLDQNGSSGFATQTWDVAGNENNFFIRDVTNGSQLPFRIEPEAPSNAIYVQGNGNIGMGTSTPDAPLEVSSSDSFIFFRMTAGGATNSSADVTYTGGPSGMGELRYNIVDGDNQEMSLDADGNLTIDGELTTAGTCSVGCDRVFDADYALLSIEEHTNAMWKHGYLPNVGPTVEGDPFNVSDKLGRVLNELEHAHIYISQQQDEIIGLSSHVETLTDRLALLEERLQN